MPIYEYKCKDPQCDHNFTVEKSMSDKTTPDCPLCNSMISVERVYTAPSFRGLPTVNWRSVKN